MNLTKKDQRRIDELDLLKKTIEQKTKSFGLTFTKIALDSIESHKNRILSKYPNKQKWSTEVDQKH